MAIMGNRTIFSSEDKIQTEAFKRTKLVSTFSQQKLAQSAIWVAMLSISTTAFATTERISINAGGTEGNDRSFTSSMSPDGRFIAFYSEAGNLVSGDIDNTLDCFVHDRKTGEVDRISVDSAGVAGDSRCFFPVISADGRYAAYYADATNLVAGDVNGEKDIFVRDRKTGTTTRISVDSTGIEANDDSIQPRISEDGRYVVFESKATNLVAGDTNGKTDVFVHDRQKGTTERISLSAEGEQGNNISFRASISADGRYVAYTSRASNLVENDTNGKDDIFVYDRDTGALERVSVASDGTEANNKSSVPRLSADGRYVTFYTKASNLVSGDTNGKFDVFLHDRHTGKTERISVSATGIEGDDSSTNPKLSADGRYVAFSSRATNLVPGDDNGKEDIFVRDRQTDTIKRLSISTNGEQGNNNARFPTISADGRQVVFQALATNLVQADKNAQRDVFVHYINQAPSFHAGSNLTVCKNAGGQLIHNWATGLNDGDPLGQPQTLSFTTISNDNPDLFGGLLNFGGNPFVSHDGKLSFRPALNASGSARICIQLKDNGGTFRGGLDKAQEQCFRITVNPDCDDGAGEIFNPGQFDFSYSLARINNIGNIPLGTIDGNNNITDPLKGNSFVATITNNGSKPVGDVVVDLTLFDHNGIVKSDERCQGDASTGQYRCSFNELPVGETQLKFLVRSSGNVTATADIQPQQVLSDSSAAQAQPTSGGGSLGWLSLLSFGLAGTRKKRAKRQ